MPQSPNSRPRRDADAAPPSRRAAPASRPSIPEAPAASGSSAAPHSPARRRRALKKAVDPGAARRAQKKAQARRRGLLAWSLALVVSVMIAGTAAGVWSELESTRQRVAQKQATLADLKDQLGVGQRRLRALSSASGKERVLVENGFIRPGERLLLFPKNPKN
ncbi:MAG TPA: hypothetical protein VF627_11155 [Abditibacterium sp.]|jgi:hypothetical protein